MMKKTALTLMLVSLICAGCATTGDAVDENEPTVIDAVQAPPTEAAASVEEPVPSAEAASKQEEGEVPLAVAESEKPDEAPEEVVVQGRRHQVIHDLVAEAQTLLSDVELQYVFTGKGKNQVLRGRPVAFALWNDAEQTWSVAQIEIPRPPITWKTRSEAAALSQPHARYPGAAREGDRCRAADVLLLPGRESFECLRT